METWTSAPTDTQQLIRHLLHKHGWQLLDEADLIQRLQARAATDAVGLDDPVALNKLAVNLYCETWHAACNSDGARRHRAYTELSHYLYDHALPKYRDPDLAHEITQDALILVHEQLVNCQNPGAFMAFALLKLWNAATAYFRRRDRQAAHITDLIDAEDEDAREPADLTTPTPEASALATEVKTTLLQRISELVQSAPRAEKQFKAVLFKFLYSYSDEEIAVALATDVANVHVLRARGLKRLRDDPMLRRLAQEMG